MTPLQKTSIGVAALMMVAVVSAQAQTRSKSAHLPPIPAANQTVRAPTISPAPESTEAPPPHTLFTIAGVPTVVWAPVEPHYDSRSNRTAAANPIWDEAGGY